MGKCLVTKLASIVNNSDLCHLNGFNFKIKSSVKGGNLVIRIKDGQTVDVYASKPITINGSTNTFLKNVNNISITPDVKDEYTTIEVVGKQNVVSFGYNTTILGKKDIIDLELNKYFSSLSPDFCQYLSGVPSFNLQEVKTNYLPSSISCERVSGDLTNGTFKIVNIDNAIGIYGDISNITSASTIRTGIVNDDNIKGSINNLSQVILLYSNKAHLTGDLSNLEHLEYVESIAPSVYTYGSNSKGSNVIVAGKVNFATGADVDNFLIYAANQNILSDSVYRRSISIYTQDGSSRTSASDSALSTLQNKGFSVMINQY